MRRCEKAANTTFANKGTLFAIIFLISCQKESNVEPQPNPTPISPIVVDDSIYISKFVDLDTTLFSGQDTLQTSKYFYDNLKRVVKIEYTEYLPSGPSLLDRSLYIYNGQDTFATKVIETLFNLPSMSLYNSLPPDTGYYTFSNGNLIKDSIRPFNSFIFRVSNYSYINTQILSSFNSAGNIFYNYFTPIRVNNNTISQKDSTISSTNYNHTLSYDNNPNPFFNKPAGPSLTTYKKSYLPREAFYNEIVNAKNNPIEVKEVGSSPGSTVFQYKCFYTYKSNGYPSIVRIKDPTTTYGIKRLMFYIN